MIVLAPVLLVFLFLQRYFTEGVVPDGNELAKAKGRALAE